MQRDILGYSRTAGLTVARLHRRAAFPSPTEISPHHGWMTDGTTSPPMLAGYRLVRRLGIGSRAEVFLGVAATDRAESPRTAVLKVFRRDLDPRDAGRELDALARVSSPHCVALLDVATAPGGLPLPILSRVPRGSVAQLLADRDSIEAGEAVTILAPLPSTITAMHRAGVAHSALSAASVHLGAAAEPVLVGLGHSTLFASGLSIAALDGVPAVLSERDRLARLVSVVLDRVRPGSASSRLRSLTEWLEATVGARRYEFAEELEQRLFDLANALPIELARMPGSSITVPARIGEVATVSPAHDERVVAKQRRRHRAGSDRSATTSSGVRIALLSGVILVNPVDAARKQLLMLSKGVRKPLWIAIAAVGLALVLALAFVPQGEAHSVSASTGVSSGAHTSAASPTANAYPTRAAAPDPVAALPALLAAREQCVHDLSVLCLDAVDEQASSALSDDSQLIMAIRAGGEIPPIATLTAGAPKVVERLGDSALVSLGRNSNPASVLMIRSKAGWRLRGFLDGEPIKR